MTRLNQNSEKNLKFSWTAKNSESNNSLNSVSKFEKLNALWNRVKSTHIQQLKNKEGSII